MKRLNEFFLDGDGINLSMTRLLLFLWSLGVLISWFYISFQTKTLAPVPESIIIILGIFITGKITQKFAEEKTSS